MGDIDAEFKCKCGQKGWISDGYTTEPCPNCGRKYIGKYNSKKYTIEAIEKRNKKENLYENIY